MPPMCVYSFEYCNTAVSDTDEVSAFTNVLKEETNNKPVNRYTNQGATKKTQWVRWPEGDWGPKCGE